MLGARASGFQMVEACSVSDGAGRGELTGAWVVSEPACVGGCPLLITPHYIKVKVIYNFLIKR